MTALLPNPLPAFTYARGGGVSRVAKGADCKSDQFAFRLNKHSEKTAKSAPNRINSLHGVSERRERGNARERPRGDSEMAAGRPSVSGHPSSQKPPRRTGGPFLVLSAPLARPLLQSVCVS